MLFNVDQSVQPTKSDFLSVISRLLSTRIRVSSDLPHESVDARYLETTNQLGRRSTNRISSTAIRLVQRFASFGRHPSLKKAEKQKHQCSKWTATLSLYGRKFDWPRSRNLSVHVLYRWRKMESWVFLLEIESEKYAVKLQWINGITFQGFTILPIGVAEESILPTSKQSASSIVVPITFIYRSKTGLNPTDTSKTKTKPSCV